MKRFIVIVFAAAIILSNFAGAAVALDLTEKIPDENTKKTALAQLTYVGLNLPLSIANKKKRINLTDVSYNTLRDVKENIGEVNDQVTFSHFYQQMGDSAGMAWNVSTIDVLMFFKYFSLGLSIDRGDFTGSGNKLWTTDMVHRFGLEIGQSYHHNDSSFFGVKFAKEKYFPSLSFKLGYCWDLSQRIKTCFEIQGICFEPQQAYTALSLSFTKRNSTNEVSVVPYWSATGESKFNIMMVGKLYVQQKQGYLSIRGVTGYFPNDNISITYNSIMRQRYLLSGEGLIKVPGVRTMLRPACGVDYLQGNDKRFHPNWFVKLGIVIPL
jgi:hypothetical protein